ncbi:hypothetical protein GGI12_002476 [Dipsacomyces acuminosporus]|nr:hypothetical protein GGI12_002476 [Dipsacomyces acuminosporus]
MSSRKGDTVQSLRSLVGDAAIESTEDLVVAVCQAIFIQLGFTLDSAEQTWTSPRLRRSQCAAVFRSGDSAVEVKWVSMAKSVMVMLAAVPPSASAGVQTIQLGCSSIVSSAARFPLKLSCDNVSADAQVLSENSIDWMFTEISRKLQAAGVGVAKQAPGFGARSSHVPDGNPHTRLDAVSAERSRSNPASIGRDDVDPIGRLVVIPPSGADEGGGGMVVGPGHPMFRRGGDGGDGFDPEIPGNPQALPPGAVPPGARFDPIGPFGQMPGPARGGRRDQGSGPSRFFSGDPDPGLGGPPNSSWNYFM